LIVLYSLPRSHSERRARRRGEMASTPTDAPADAPADARAPGADPGETEAPAPSSEPSAPDVSSSDEADEPEFASPHRLASPAALAEYRQYATRVDELREATRARLAETRGAYDEHNALVETNEFVRKETALLDSLFAQILDARRREERIPESFTDEASSNRGFLDDHARFALEASLRRAREGVEAVLRKSTARADDARTRLRAAEAAAAAAEEDERRQIARRAELAEALLGFV